MHSVYLCLIFACATFAQETSPGATPSASAVAAVPPATTDPLVDRPGLYATFDTSLGQIVVQLLEDKAPQTVQNFVALANGVKRTLDAEGKMRSRRFFDGLVFHRVIRGFMIQTGDVNGTGDSDCGVDPIPDEIDASVLFNAPGRLAMANIGRPDTAACQIFITVGPAQHLNGTFTIFGIVASGQDIADKIASVPVTGERPITPVTLNRVTVERRVAKDN